MHVMSSGKMFVLPWAVLCLLVISGGQCLQNAMNETAQAYEVEDLLCSGGKASYGLSVGTPSEVEWQQRGNKLAPFSICLFCSAVDGENTEFLQESCSYFGAAKRATLVQRFECVRGEFLRGFTGANSSADDSPMDSRLRCRVPDKDHRNKDDSTYQVAFPPSRQSSRRSRSNWRLWGENLDMECKDREEFVCGIRIKKNTNKRMPPTISPMCCEVRYKKNEALSFKEDGIMMSLGDGETDVTMVAMSAVIIVLALALLVCIVNVCCCRILPGDCTPKADPEAYESDKNDRPKSQLNSRPNTVKPQEGAGNNGNNNQMAPPEDVEANSSSNGNGNSNNGARIKRPNTSTLRRADSGISGK